MNQENQSNCNTLNLSKEQIEDFSKTLNDNSQCYKFYWMEALIKIAVQKNKKRITFDEVTNEMILSAWYTVAEYHLHMGNPYAGKHDVGALEKAINKLQMLSHLNSDADESDIRNALAKYSKNLLDEKRQLTDLVPHKLLSKMVNLPKGKGATKSLEKIYKIIELESQNKDLPYYIEFGPRMECVVVINDLWADFFDKNSKILYGWINEKKVEYLQKRNPGVPAIICKISKPEKNRESLKEVRILWNEIIRKEIVLDVYSESIIELGKYHLDHFIPWSYLFADELWNLSPTLPKYNSSKSNNLPNWELYYPRFLRNQYKLYCWKTKDESINNLFNKCLSHHLNAIWAIEDLFFGSYTLSEFDKIL